MLHGYFLMLGCSLVFPFPSVPCWVFSRQKELHFFKTINEPSSLLDQPVAIVSGANKMKMTSYMFICHHCN